jgi:hypothetical protein
MRAPSTGGAGLTRSSARQASSVPARLSAASTPKFHSTPNSATTNAASSRPTRLEATTPVTNAASAEAASSREQRSPR